MLASTLAALDQIHWLVVTMDNDLGVLASEGPGLAAVGLAPGAGVGLGLRRLLGDADPPGAAEAACERARDGETTRLTMKWRGARCLVTALPRAGGADLVAVATKEPVDTRDSLDALGGLINQLDGMVYRCRVDEAWTMEIVTDGCLPITGYTAAQLRMNQEVAFGDLVHPDDQGWLWEKCQTNLACRRSCSNQYRIRHADGSIRWIWDRAHGVYDEAGTMLKVEGLITDITAERTRELERARLDEQVRHAQRLDSLGLLAGGVAHDFNGLLQLVLGHARLARADLPADSSPAADLDAIAQAAQRASDLTRQLLTFGSRQRVELTVVDLNEVVDVHLRLLRRLLPATIVVDFIPGRRLPMVEVDVTQLQQVLTNLCLNARDAMGAGGRLTVESETILINGEYRQAHPWAVPGRYVLLSVTDNGAGIPADVMPQIFEPFFTTKSPGEGTGLGLALVYGIVRAHDGMVHVYSEPGVGTTFKVYLPASHRLAASVGTKLEVAPVGGRERVLVIEDDAGIRNLARRILRGAGYDVLEAVDGPSALKLVATGEQIDLALTDAVMPGLSGPETLRQLRVIRPELKTILSTGHSADRFVDELGVDVLLKPYAPDQLLRMVRRVLDAP